MKESLNNELEPDTLESPKRIKKIDIAWGYKIEDWVEKL